MTKDYFTWKTTSNPEIISGNDFIMTARKPKVGISSCLLGECVRYDGGHRHNPYITDILGKYFKWLPVCPEVEYGLGIPREPMRLVGDPAKPRIVTISSGLDHTAGMIEWIENRLPELEKEDLSGFIFKSMSPSSAIRGVTVFSAEGHECGEGPGIFGGAFVERFPLIPVIDDEELRDPALRSNFFESVFSHKRSKGPKKHG